MIFCPFSDGEIRNAANGNRRSGLAIGDYSGLRNSPGNFATLAAIRLSAIEVATSVAPATWQSLQQSFVPHLC
jgi:hypothetical protein